MKLFLPFHLFQHDPPIILSMLSVRCFLNCGDQPVGAEDSCGDPEA